MSQDDFSTGTVELEDAELKFDKPPLYTVVILKNDDFTPMEFVVTFCKNSLIMIMLNLLKSCCRFTMKERAIVALFTRNCRN